MNVTFLFLNNCSMLPAGSLTQSVVLSFSACLLITPPCLNQQFSTHDNNIVLATANSLENTTARLTISCKISSIIIMLVNSAVLLILRALQKGHSTPSLPSNINDITFSSKLLRAAFILNIGYNGLYLMLGNITCEHW